MHVLISTLALLFIAGCASLAGTQPRMADQMAMTDNPGTRVMSQSEARTVRAGDKTVYAQGRH